jgi:hypothetical protein
MAVKTTDVEKDAKRLLSYIIGEKRDYGNAIDWFIDGWTRESRYNKTDKKKLAKIVGKKLEELIVSNL